MSAEQLDALYRDAALIINMHGGTLPLPEHAATDRLIFLGTDPVEVELEVERGEKHALEFLDQHVAHFTWGLNYGNPDCGLPWARPYAFVPSPPPVVLDLWENTVEPEGPFTTIGNWRQRYRDVQFRDRVFRWSKHQQFMKILDLPSRTEAPIELALSSYDGRDRMLLAEHGWRVRPGLELSRDLDSYRDYIINSAGEISAAKEQNVHFRTGWFSERSVTYLASGRPVIVQDTGFGGALPTGEGLFGFTGLDDAAAAVEAVQADPKRHRQAASEIAHDYLGHEVVLGNMLDHVGLRRRPAGKRSRKTAERLALPADLPLEAASARPREEAQEYLLRRPVPSVTAPAADPLASVVVAIPDNLAYTRFALESLLANTNDPPYEVLVVDNGSADPTRQYLEVLQSRNRHVHVIRNRRNLGFAAGCSEGLAAAKSDILVLLTGDTVVTPGWLADLARHLDDPKVGLVGAVSNLNGRGAPGRASYETYGEMLRFARARRQDLAGSAASEVETADVACVAIRREVFEEIGPPDGHSEDFEGEFARSVRDAWPLGGSCRGGLRAPVRGGPGPAPGREGGGGAGGGRRSGRGRRGRADRVSGAASGSAAARRGRAPFPEDLVLTPVSRRPTRLEPAAVRSDPRSGRPRVSGGSPHAPRGFRRGRHARQPGLPPALPRERPRLNRPVLPGRRGR